MEVSPALKPRPRGTVPPQLFYPLSAGSSYFTHYRRPRQFPHIAVDLGLILGAAFAQRILLVERGQDAGLH